MVWLVGWGDCCCCWLVGFDLVWGCFCWLVDWLVVVVVVCLFLFGLGVLRWVYDCFAYPVGDLKDWKKDCRKHSSVKTGKRTVENSSVEDWKKDCRKHSSVEDWKKDCRKHSSVEDWKKDCRKQFS